MKSLQLNPDKIKAFFKAPYVKYAACFFASILIWNQSAFQKKQNSAFTDMANYS